MQAPEQQQHNLRRKVRGGALVSLSPSPRRRWEFGFVFLVGGGWGTGGRRGRLGWVVGVSDRLACRLGPLCKDDGSSQIVTSLVL